MVKNPKSFFVDSGLRNQLIGNFSPLENRPDQGALFENLVWTILYRHFHSTDTSLRYWHTKAGAEVDFVLQKGELVIPIEAKYSFGASKTIGKSLHSFIQKYHPPLIIIFTLNDHHFFQVDQTPVHVLPLYYF